MKMLIVAGALVVSANTLHAEQLELISWNCETEHSYTHLRGEVRNISNGPLEVLAVGTLRTADGTFINSSSSMVEYYPLMPNQVSPFDVIIRANPLGTKCSLGFRESGGRALGTLNRDKSPPRKQSPPRNTLPKASIQKAQESLAYLGYDVGTPDGIVGPKTRSAVKAFQRSKRLDETGEITENLVWILGVLARHKKEDW